LTNTPASAPATTATATKSKENSYAKPGVDKCYGCREPGHKSNECPKRKQVKMTDYEDDEREGFKIEELNDFNFADKHVEWGICNLCCSEIGVQ